MPAVAGTKRGNLLRVKPENLVVDKALNYSREGQTDWAIAEMCASILADPERGVRDPIGVERIYPDAENGDARFQVVKGFRRALGAQMAVAQHGWGGLVPAVQWEGDETERVVDNLLENDQREDITPFGRLACYARLDALGLSVVQIAHLTGRAKDFVSDHLKLREALPAVREALQAGKATWGVVRQVLRVAPEEQQAMLDTLAGTTVIEARRRVNRTKRGKAPKVDGDVLSQLVQRIDDRRAERKQARTSTPDFDEGYTAGLSWVEKIIGELRKATGKPKGQK